MSEPTPESTPEKPEQPKAPDGWELACIGIVRSEFGRLRSRALKKAVMQLSAEKAWEEGRREAARISWWRKLQGAFTARPAFRFAFAMAMIAASFLRARPVNAGESAASPAEPVAEAETDLAP